VGGGARDRALEWLCLPWFPCSGFRLWLCAILSGGGFGRSLPGFLRSCRSICRIIPRSSTRLRFCNFVVELRRKVLGAHVAVHSGESPNSVRRDAGLTRDGGRRAGSSLLGAGKWREVYERRWGHGDATRRGGWTGVERGRRREFRGHGRAAGKHDYVEGADHGALRKERQARAGLEGTNELGWAGAEGMHSMLLVATTA
jgi:hypothetical protein